MTNRDANNSAKSRARGCLLGQIAGDALGTTVEFESADRIARAHPGGLRDIVGGGPFRVQPGQVTDDTELALALARSVVAAGCYDRDAAAASYLAWMRSRPFDIGNTTRQAFGGSSGPVTGAGVASFIEARASCTSQANGALMRASPLGIYGASLAPDDLATMAAADARLSHGHPACQAANVVYAHAIAFAIRTGATPAEVYAEARRFAMANAAAAPAVEWLDAAAERAPEDFSHHMGWVWIAFQNAFHRLLHAPSFEEGVVATVMAGGDTDTNGCVAGALLGAVHGEEAIPARWRASILACRTERGATYQTGDAIELADALLACGARRPTEDVRQRC